MTPTLSIVIPAYNEAQRLPQYLEAIRTYTRDSMIPSYEVVIVDDGSSDETCEIVAELAQQWPELRLERQERNQGKGAAVRRGVLAAKGEFILFADADGATPISEERKLRDALDAGADLAVGSRLLSRSNASCQRAWHRRIIGLTFSTLTRGLLGIPVRDTQCGFKMFRSHVGHALFQPCRESGYLFDLHVLALAASLEYKHVEIPIVWRDVPGSKLRLASDSWKMLLGLLCLRFTVASAAASVRATGTTPDHSIVS